MEVRLTGGNTKPNTVTGRVNPAELTPETYEYYCRLYLIERIYEEIPITSVLEYGHVAKLINSISSTLFKNLQLETNKILLLNKIYSLFRSASNEEISREFLYEKMVHLASCDPYLNGYVEE